MRPIGSQIDVAQNTAQVRAGDGPLLAFTGEGALWWIANTPPAALWATVDRLVVQITKKSAAP